MNRYEALNEQQVLENEDLSSLSLKELSHLWHHYTNLRLSTERELDKIAGELRIREARQRR